MMLFSHYLQQGTFCFTRGLTILTLLLTLISCGQTPIRDEIASPEHIAQQNAQYEFQRQQALASTMQASTDFSALRHAYARTEQFSPWDMTEHQAGIAMLNALEDDNPTLCAALAGAMVDRNFTSLMGHYGLGTCGKHSEDIDDALHLWIAKGLLKSIEDSGDGLTPDTAFICNSSVEMRSFIQLSGLLMFRQENVNSGFKQIERALTMNPETEEMHTLYFDLTAARLRSFAPNGF